MSLSLSLSLSLLFLLSVFLSFDLYLSPPPLFPALSLSFFLPRSLSLSSLSLSSLSHHPSTYQSSSPSPHKIDSTFVETMPTV